MRRALSLLIVVTLMVGGRLAFAATLPLGPTNLAASTVAVTACDRDGVKVAYRLAWTGHITINQIVVTGIADACIGQQVGGVLMVGDGATELAPALVVASRPNDNTAVIRVTADVSAIATRSVHLVIV